MPRIFPFMRNIFDGSREIGLLSDTHGYTPAGLESTTSQFLLHLPEVCAPAQYLIDVGLLPSLARRLSSTYMEFVVRYRETCQSHFDRATYGLGHLREHHHEVFVILFKRTIQSLGSQLVSIVRVWLCQAGAFQATIRSERVDIRVDDAAKAEIIARLGHKVTHPTFDRMVTNPSAGVTSRLEEVSKQKYALSTATVDSRVMLSKLSPISSTEVTSRPLDPFCQPAPSTCFPAPYPPPPAYSSSYSPQSTLATSFVSPVLPRIVRPLTSYSPDVSSLTNLFGRMTVTTLKADSTNPKSHGMFGTSEYNKIKPVPSAIAAKCSTEPQLASIESITSPPKSTSTVRRRKIAALPTRRGKISASPSPLIFDSAGATSCPIPRLSERVVEETPPDHLLTSPQKFRHVSTLPSLYSAEASCVATSKSSTRQRKVHTLHHKTLPQPQTIPQNRSLTPRATVGKTFSYSRSPPLVVSDTTSFFDSPPTSSDELDTPPSTPPRLQVLLARSSTESLAISSESDRIVSHEEPLGDVKVPNPRRRYRRLDFTKGGLGGDEQPLTFTFSV